MGKMFDNVRAFWNDLGDRFSNPGKLAQLNVADLEKAIIKAKDAAAPVIGRPRQLETELKNLETQDSELTKKIKSLIAVGENGMPSARSYIERQVELRKILDAKRVEYDDASMASQEWLNRIRVLETELYKRRNRANSLQAEYESAKAETALSKTMQNVDSIAGTDTFSRLEQKVAQEKAKAAGYSAMSGLDTKIAEEKMIRDSEVDILMREYLG